MYTQASVILITNRIPLVKGGGNIEERKKRVGFSFVLNESVQYG